MDTIVDGLSVFAVSLLLTGIIIPQILLIAFKKKLFDVPDERKIHQGVVPRLGGIAFMPAIVFSLCFVNGVKRMLFPAHNVPLSEMFANQSDMVVLCFGLCALMMMYLIGIADDLVGVKYRAKFVGQILAAGMLSAAGVRLVSLHDMLGFDVIPVGVSCFISIVLVVYIINAFNLIDGIDGLASGLGGIAFAFYAVAFYVLGRPQLCLLSLAALGTLVPFFYYNVFGNPNKRKKIFMGDTGALTIGLLLSFLSMSMTRVDVDEAFGTNIMILAFSPLAVPCLDVLRVFVHRILRGHSPFLPDRVHIHHKFLALGIAHRPAMIMILLLGALVIFVNMMLSQYMGVFAVLVCDLCLWVAFNWTLTRAIRKRQARGDMSCEYE